MLTFKYGHSKKKTVARKNIQNATRHIKRNCKYHF